MTRQPVGTQSDLRSSTQPLSGLRSGKTGHTRVTPSSPNYRNTLASRMWETLNALGTSNPELVSCKMTDGALPTRQCMTWDPSSRADFIDCFSQSDDSGDSDQWDPARIDNIFCNFTSTQWPKVSPYLTSQILIHLGASGSALPQSVGQSKKIVCTGDQCSFEGFGNDVRPYLAKRVISRPATFGSLTPPPDARGSDGRPLPTSSKLSRIMLPGGEFNAHSWKAKESSLKVFREWLPADEKASFDDRIDEVDYKSRCRLEEIHALQSYTLEGYREVNSTLRTLANGGAAPTSTVAERVNLTVSAVNCAKQTRAGILIRGAKLKPEQLARYQPGSFVVEAALTSTTMGEQVLSEFRGNVEFQIFDGQGADLSDLSMMAEEGEGELLFQAGSLFKVLSTENDEDLTIIKMVYVP